jgi:6-phosphogluconolactonase
MMGWVGRVAAAIGVWALVLTTGCAGFFVYPGSTTSSGSTGTTGTGDYVYVANGTTQTVAAYEVGSGTLTAVTGSPFVLGYAPTAAVVNPANTILFVSSISGVYSYAIASDGALSNLSSITSGLDDVVSLAVSPDGNWLFALSGIASTNVVTLYEFSINSSSGAFSAVNSSNQTYTGTYTITAPGSTIAATALQVTVATVSSGEYVFVALGTGGTLIVPFNTSTGAQVLTGAAQFAIPGGSSIYLGNDALAVNSSTSVLYVVDSNSQSNGTIAAYTIGSNGTQATLTGVTSVSTAELPVAAVLNTAGSDVYVANQDSDSISGLATSGLSSLYTPSSYGYAPTGLAVDHSGDYLLAISSTGGPDLTMYSYGSAGQLVEAASANIGGTTEPAGAVAIAATH